MSVGFKLVNRAIQDGDITTLLKEGVVEEFFTGTELPVYTYVVECFEKHGTLPTKSMVKDKFPAFVEENVTMPIEYWVTEIIQRKRYGFVVDAVKKSAGALKSFGGVDDAVDVLMRGVGEAHRVNKSVKIYTLESEVDNRWEVYENRKHVGGVDGYKSGFTCIDEETYGYHKGDLITVLGRPAIGKTWLLLLQALSIAKEYDEGVLFASKEMPPEILMERVDSVMCSLPYQNFRGGRLTTPEEERFRKYLAEVKAGKVKLPIEFMKAPRGLSDIKAKLLVARPKVLFVDGVYLFDVGGRKWDVLAAMTSELKQIAMDYDIPVIISSQLGRSGAYVSVEDLVGEMAGYSDAVQQDSDVVIGMFLERLMYGRKEMGIKFLKIRENEFGKAYVLNWDFSKMVFGVKGVMKEVEDEQEEAEF